MQNEMQRSLPAEGRRIAVEQNDGIGVCFYGFPRRRIFGIIRETDSQPVLSESGGCLGKQFDVALLGAVQDGFGAARIEELFDILQPLDIAGS